MLAPPHRGAEPAQGGVAEGCDGTYLSQNVDHDTITPLNTPHCIEVGVASLGTGYARSYAAQETSTVGCVRFAIEFNNGAAWPVSVRIYRGDVNGPYANLVLLAETSVEIPADSGASIRTATFPGNGPTVEAGTSFVVEVYSPTRSPAAGGDGGFLFFGSNDAGQSAPSYIRAVECSVPDFIDVASIGWPQTDIIIDPNLNPTPIAWPCGSPQAGSCFVPHSTPNCNNANCCELLCALIDPTCCQLAWDVICVQEAMTFGECILAAPPCQGLKAFECQAGCVDNFAAPVDPAHPSAELAAGLNCGAFGDFDLQQVDHCIAHTFTGCWPSCGPDCPQPGCGTIVGATLAVHMRSLGTLSGNDTLGLYDGGSVLWAANIGTLTGNPGWPAGADATIVLNLGPNPLPNTIQVPASSGVLASLCDGELGMLVQDDTMVDYAKLTVFVCPCEQGIRIPFERDSADDFTSPTPTTPSAALLAHVNCGAGSLQSYDVQALDQCFVETISGLPSCIMGATLTMGVRPDSLWWTDGLALDVVDQCGKVFKWSRSLTSLDAIGAFSPPLASGQLSTLTLDLGNLPPSADGTRSVLSTMLDGSLDIYLQDDTGVDFIFLDVLSCECGGGGGPIGACCLPPEVPGGDYHCADLTQSQCEFNGGTWWGPSFTCAEVQCKGPCATPPWGMVAWYPLEPTTGIVADDITVLQNNGVFGPQATGGPQSGPGVVGGAYFFNGQGDFITVPPDPSIDFSCKPFSIDLWVKRAAPGPNPAFVNLVGNYGASTGGWVFGIDESTGQLELITESDCLRCIALSTGTVPVGVWTHVAISITGCDCSIPCFEASNRLVSFFINGALAGTGGACCNLANQPVPAPIVIGGSVWVASAFKGGMDEVELFCNYLDQADFYSIWSAGSSGKCKQHCHASWDRQVCMNFTPTAPADITICNDGGTPQNYTWFVSPSGACAISGVTYSPSTGTVTVPPGGCVTIPITANVSGASGLGPACFNVTFINNSTGQVCTAMGMMFVDICGIIVFPDPPIAAVPWETATSVNFTVSSAGFGGDLPYLIKALPSDMESGNEVVSLNGLPPGTRYIGNLSVQPGQTVPLTFEAAFIAPDSFRWYDVILEIDPDGDGIYQPISSIGIHQVEAPSCTGDLNGDGVVNAQDLGILLGAWGTGGVGDINGDGVVDAQDLGILLGAWGNC
ncbi:MAG: LamG-like jellyroll fold domain-containing protein [Phycisphaerales bacterium]